MIAIQVILVLGFILLFWRFIANPNSHQIHAWIKILTFLFTLLAVVAVIFPDTANRLAHSVGVKTGANLLLYALTLAFIFVVINLYTRNKEEERRRVIIVRRIALLEAQLNAKNKSKK
jgi:small membrane protein